MKTKEKMIHLYRKRHVPNELVHLKDDLILLKKDDLIITKWNTLKPRHDIAGGISAYFIEKGIKVSHIHNSKNQLVYWYCDIIETTYDSSSNTYIFEDLLIDVIIYENGTVRVVDLDEVGDALENHILDIPKVSKALHITNTLLKRIDNGEFKEYQELIRQFC